MQKTQKSFRVKLKKSTIGATQRQKDAIRCLGLKKIGSEVVLKDHPATRGQILKIQHMVDVHVEK